MQDTICRLAKENRGILLHIPAHFFDVIGVVSSHTVNPTNRKQRYLVSAHLCLSDRNGRNGRRVDQVVHALVCCFASQRYYATRCQGPSQIDRRWQDRPHGLPLTVTIDGRYGEPGLHNVLYSLLKAATAHYYCMKSIVRTCSICSDVHVLPTQAATISLHSWTEFDYSVKVVMAHANEYGHL